MFDDAGIEYDVRHVLRPINVDACFRAFCTLTVAADRKQYVAPLDAVSTLLALDRIIKQPRFTSKTLIGSGDGIEPRAFEGGYSKSIERRFRCSV